MQYISQAVRSVLRSEIIGSALLSVLVVGKRQHQLGRSCVPVSLSKLVSRGRKRLDNCCVSCVGWTPQLSKTIASWPDMCTQTRRTNFFFLALDCTRFVYLGHSRQNARLGKNCRFWLERFASDICEKDDLLWDSGLHGSRDDHTSGVPIFDHPTRRK